MKKQSIRKSVLMIAALVMSAVLLTGCMVESIALPFQGNFNASPAAEQNSVNFGQNATEPEQNITLEEAKAIAFNKAGVTEAEATDKDYDLEWGVYEIDFDFNGMEYDYHIDAKTGEIIYENVKPDYDVKHKTEQPVNPQEPKPQQQEEIKPAPEQPKTDITANEAKAIALAAAGVTEARDFDLDFEWGVYEIGFEANNMEYEYHIDAKTGAIIYSYSEPENDLYDEPDDFDYFDDFDDFDDRYDDDWDDRYDGWDD